MMCDVLRTVTVCTTAFNFAVTSPPTNLGPGEALDEGMLAASPTDDTHVLLEYSWMAPAPPTPSSPAKSCEGFFTNISEIISHATPKANPN